MAKGKKKEEVIVEAPVVLETPETMEAPVIEEVITPVKHPLAEKLTTIGEQIMVSGKFQNPIDFLEGLVSWAEIKSDLSMRELFEGYADYCGMFVTEKDLVSDMVVEKLDAKVLTIRKSTDTKYTLQVVKNDKKQTIYVENIDGDYFWGIGNMQIEKL